MAPSTAPSELRLAPLPTFKPDLYQRAWASVPHPTLPLLATTHAKAVTVFSLSTLSKHSALTGGHTRSVRCATWKPNLPPHELCLVTGSFDATAGLWRWDGERANNSSIEVEVTQSALNSGNNNDNDSDAEEDKDKDEWEFTLVLEGHENEIKSAAFSPSGQYLATCSRDKSVWVWEDVGATETDDEWETVAVLSEHDGDVKAVAWCPDVPGRTGRGRYSADVLASASYDNTARIWREDGDGEWVCVAVLEGHDGTVWGLQWEPNPRGDAFPRLLTFSADGTIRIWTLKEEKEEEEGGGGPAGNSLLETGFGRIPNTMRRSLREDWECTAVLPKAHTRDIYSAAWSPTSGLVASTGSDGIIAVYDEDVTPAPTIEQDVHMTTPSAEQSAAGPVEPATNGHSPQPAATNGASASANGWRILTTVGNGHGPYEINHVTWCKRFDPGTELKGIEEMLVSTGDDGIVRPWQLIK